MAQRTPMKREIRMTTPAVYDASELSTPAVATVGAAAVLIRAARSDRTQISVQAEPGPLNTVPIYIGISGGVTPSTALGVVEPGQAFNLGAYLGDVWAVSSLAGQDLHTIEIVRT